MDEEPRDDAIGAIWGVIVNRPHVTAAIMAKLDDGTWLVLIPGLPIDVARHICDLHNSARSESERLDRTLDDPAAKAMYDAETAALEAEEERLAERAIDPTICRQCGHAEEKHQPPGLCRQRTNSRTRPKLSHGCSCLEFEPGPDGSDPLIEAAIEMENRQPMCRCGHGQTEHRHEGKGPCEGNHEADSPEDAFPCTCQRFAL